MTYAVGPNLDRVVRLLVGTIGGYAFTAGYIAIAAIAIAATGISRAEAVTLAYVSGLIIYVFIVIWSAATRALLRTSFLIFGLGGAMIMSAASLA